MESNLKVTLLFFREAVVAARGKKVKSAERLCLQCEITDKNEAIYVHAHIANSVRQLFSMMSGDIICLGVRDCLLLVQIPLS